MKLRSPALAVLLAAILPLATAAAPEAVDSRPRPAAKVSAGAPAAKAATAPKAEKAVVKKKKTKKKNATKSAGTR